MAHFPLAVHRRREVSEFQEQVGKFLGGYLSREWENAKVGATLGEEFEPESIVAGIQLPDVPQQERANDCGYFVLEQILRLLQLGPEALRALATASAEEVMHYCQLSRKVQFRCGNRGRRGCGRRCERRWKLW